MSEHAKRRIRMQVRATPEAGEGTFTAKVSTYDLEYDVGWGWTEKIMPGCFTDSIGAHPTIPIFYNHDWYGAPIGSGKPTQNDDNTLTVAGRLYLELGDPLVARVYQAMKDEALEEWSIGFWPEQITWDSDNPTCDTIVSGDLAEASICVRGANPDTGTLELHARRKAWIDGDEKARQVEVSRLRALSGPGSPRPRGRAATAATERADAEPEHTPAELAQAVDALIDQIKVLLDEGDSKGALDLVVAADSTVDELLEAMGVPDDDDIAETETRRRAAGHTHEHKHGDTVHSHAHTHSGGTYEHDASDPEVTHAHGHPDGPGDTGESEDPGPDQSDRLLESPYLRRLAVELGR